MFSWDAAKAIRNYEKHGVTFDEAKTVFADQEGIDWNDFRRSESEDRFRRVGRSVAERVILVVYTKRRANGDKETIRIISARQASRKERRSYAGQ